MPITTMKISELKVEEPFKNLFLIDEKVLSDIRMDMQEKGFDSYKQLDVWFKSGQYIVIDGHTRLQAAKDLGIEEITVRLRRFKSEDDALMYAIKNQRNRRNLSDGQLLHFVKQVDRLFPKGGDRKSIFWNQKIDNEGITRDSRKLTAESIGMSPYQVSLCRHILKHCKKNAIEEIVNGSRTLHQAYKSSLDAQKNEDKKIQKQDERREILLELKTGDYPGKLSKNFISNHDYLAVNLLAFCKRAPEMQKIREAVEFIQSQGENMFEIFRNKLHIQRFLGSCAISDLLDTLRCFGYTIEKHSDQKVIEEKRPVKKKKPAPRPENSAARFNEPGFVSRAEWKKIEQHIHLNPNPAGFSANS